MYIVVGGRGEVADDPGVVCERNGSGADVESAADALSAPRAADGGIEGNQYTGEGRGTGVVDAASLAVRAAGAADRAIAADGPSRDGEQPARVIQDTTALAVGGRCAVSRGPPIAWLSDTPQSLRVSDSFTFEIAPPSPMSAWLPAPDAGPPIA